MEYYIAVASTDGINIDKKLGKSDSFFIVKVNEDETYEILGERKVKDYLSDENKGCKSINCGHSYGHNVHKLDKIIQTISDCRCLICNKCGPGAEKQLGKNNISIFAIDMKLEEALPLIITYYKKVFS